MALKLPNGQYVRINADASNFLNGHVAHLTYADSSQRDVEKATGSLPPFTINAGETTQCPSLLIALDSPFTGIKSGKDEILSLAYTALKVEKFPDATDI